MQSETAALYHAKERMGLTASNVTSLFQPDRVLASQFFDDRRTKTILEPEKRLMLAILEDAVHCFRDNCSAKQGKKKRLFDSAKAWLFGTDDWVFGFQNICSVLGLNPEYVLKGLARWQTKQLSQHHNAPLCQETKKSRSLEF
jgi:hypothetical protein